MARPKATHHRVEVTVCGTGRFPLDMLRYDQCTPRTSSDATAITEGEFSSTPYFRVVNLNTYNSPTNGNAVMTTERWESFGWFVLTAQEIAAYHSNTSIDAIKDLQAVIQARQDAR